MHKKIFLPFLVTPLCFMCAFSSGVAAANDQIRFSPVEHASFVIEAAGITIFVDPVGALERYKAFAAPDIILITDIHSDHLDAAVVGSLRKETTTIIGPQAVIAELGYGEAIAEGQIKTAGAISVEAVPAYNLTKERLQFHQRGRGIGYVLTITGKRIYISGDTEDIPEMRNLKNIDYAFVCMNLPYTMTVEQAADAVAAFSPAVVFPYHFRGRGGVSDVERFKKLAEEKSPGIEVRIMPWYPSR